MQGFRLSAISHANQARMDEYMVCKPSLKPGRAHERLSYKQIKEDIPEIQMTWWGQYTIRQMATLTLLMSQWLWPKVRANAA